MHKFVSEFHSTNLHCPFFVSNALRSSGFGSVAEKYQKKRNAMNRNAVFMVVVVTIRVIKKNINCKQFQRNAHANTSKRVSRKKTLNSSYYNNFFFLQRPTNDNDDSTCCNITNVKINYTSFHLLGHLVTQKWNECMCFK